ncbi:hypothetical protein SADUNF_Sadunf05G0167000 [Salix dunnii]|uniref:Uncharacterized protein n=1 Tax=Salix dunnii TaxID=1413687 RepID=A0A835MXY4_9ROSI|nr:hypothetical protein SADUNF_Sadunf05G0167000 [Salix dunnii]
MIKAMLATAQNYRILLTICIANTSTNETENEKIDGERFVKVTEIDKKMYAEIALVILIFLTRSFGETGMSNFLLGQKTYTSSLGS